MPIFNDKTEFMKRKQLTMQQLGMISNALMKNLYPTPTKTDLLVEENSTAKGDGLYLYFSSNYFEELSKIMQDHISSGSYSQSNAESDWLDLVKAIMNAENISTVDQSNLRPHFLAN